MNKKNNLHIQFDAADFYEQFAQKCVQLVFGTSKAQ